MKITIIKSVNSYALFCLLGFPLGAIAANIDPALTTPAEQTGKNKLEAQEQLRQQEILKSLRQQQEIKPDARVAGEQLKSTAPAAPTSSRIKKALVLFQR